MDNSNAIYYNNRSLALILQEKYVESYMDSSKALQLNPSYVKAYLRKSEALLELDR